MTIRLLNSDRLLLSAALSAALLAGCSRMNASTDNNEPVRPGQTSADTVVAHTFPEHRKPLDAAGRSLKVPQGFSVDVFATGIMGASARTPRRCDVGWPASDDPDRRAGPGHRHRR